MFRFTIRELVLLTVMVALGAAWWMDHSQLSTFNARLTIQVQTLETQNRFKGALPLVAALERLLEAEGYCVEWKGAAGCHISKRDDPDNWTQVISIGTYD